MRDGERDSRCGAQVDGTIVLEGLGVLSQEVASVEDVLSNVFVGPVGDLSHVDVASPAGGSSVVDGGLGGDIGVAGDVGALLSDGLHLKADGRGRGELGSGVDDTEHSLLAMAGGTAEEVRWLGVIDNLVVDEVLVLDTRGEEGITSAVAREESRGLGHGVVVGAPHELDGVTDGGVDGEGNVTQDTLGGGDNDGVGSTSSSDTTAVGSSGGGGIGTRLLAVGSHALADTIGVLLVAPVSAARAVLWQVLDRRRDVDGAGRRVGDLQGDDRGGLALLLFTVADESHHGSSSGGDTSLACTLRCKLDGVGDGDSVGGRDSDFNADSTVVLGQGSGETSCHRREGGQSTKDTKIVNHFDRRTNVVLKKKCVLCK